MANGNGPRIEVDPQLQPWLREFDFAQEDYAYGLKLMGASEEAVNTAVVTFAHSGRKNQLDTASMLLGASSWGMYEEFANRIVMWPRAIASGAEKTARRLPSELVQQSTTALSAAHNSVLLHESGHLIDMTNQDVNQRALSMQRSYEGITNTRSEAAAGALLGAIGGSEISAVTDFTPIAGSIAGALVLGGIGLVTAGIGSRSNVAPEIARKHTGEQFAYSFEAHPTAIALMGNIIQIELRKRPARHFFVGAKATAAAASASVGRGVA